jgi:hypothetical protein
LRRSPTPRCGSWADFQGLGISGSIANKLREAQIRLDEIVPAEGTSEKPDLGDLEQLAGLTRAEVIEVERCVEERLRDREVKPAAAVPAKKKRGREEEGGGRVGGAAGAGVRDEPQVRSAAKGLKENAPAKAQELREGRSR